MIMYFLLCALLFIQKGKNMQGCHAHQIVFLQNSSQKDPQLGPNCRDFLQHCEESEKQGFCKYSFYNIYCCQTCTLAKIVHTTTETTTIDTFNLLFPFEGLLKTTTSKPNPNPPSDSDHIINFGNSDRESANPPLTNRNPLFLPEEKTEESDRAPDVAIPTTSSTTASTTTTIESTITTSKEASDEEPEEDSCRTASGKLGTCVILKHCPPVIEAITHGEDYRLCGFDGRNPIACCPPFDQYYNVPGCGIRITHNKEEELDDDESEELEDDDQRILGGRVSQSNSWPWMAILSYKDSGFGTGSFCSASIISERFVITAAHCVQEPDPFVVRLGEHDYLRTNETFAPEDVDVEEVLFYPSYDFHRGYHDIALIKLAKDVNIKRDHIRAVCLPWGQETSNHLIGKSVVITGWGVTAFGGEPSSALREVLVKVFPTERCAQSYSRLEDFKALWPNGLTQRDAICAGTKEGGKDACQGDSGGPLVISDYRSVYFLMGVVSKGFGCGQEDYPGIYAPLPNKEHLDWIKKIVFPNTNIGNKI